MSAPSTPAELAEALREAAGRGQTIALAGNSTKRLMAGPLQPADIAITTQSLRRVVQYEPHDLTISVDAGLAWCQLEQMLAANRQMVPLDPPFAGGATVGGVISANSSGPRRRLYGTARDLVIGMSLATVEGKLVQTGGMVVKNVAGLDMAKLMIGSFGTLAAIATVNFKLQPMPEVERSFIVPFDSAAQAVAARDSLLKGQLQPAAIDLLNPAAASGIGLPRWALALRAGGNAEAVERYEREFAQLGETRAFENDNQRALWRQVEEFTPQFLAAHEDGAVVRASCTLKELEAVVTSFPGAVIARAASGVCYGYFEQWRAAAAWLKDAVRRGWKAVIEFAPDACRRKQELWPAPGADWELMKRVKNVFDPSNLLNRGRLYRRI
ncbi:MAG TPA: FAD-binding oxidoreductase [Candidatus Acidoferrales bacterium]|nr:FAD-binding oxidoreductase [Candidatus Acidoferrales bacterium]